MLSIIFMQILRKVSIRRCFRILNKLKRKMRGRCQQSRMVLLITFSIRNSIIYLHSCRILLSQMKIIKIVHLKLLQNRFHLRFKSNLSQNHLNVKEIALIRISSKLSAAKAYMRKTRRRFA
jgi:hypothetical protein